MPQLEPLPANQRVVALNNDILRAHSVELPTDARILDYGCGSGRHTYEYLDAGYGQTWGFDVADYVQLRDDDDRERFRFLDTQKPFQLPFPDDHFDLVTSTSVFEHVMNLEESIAEIARVLKPNGVTLHAFPSRWRPIEPHMFVPFGGAIQSRWWYALWARLGIRNEFQRGASAAETATRNLEFSRTGIHYPSHRRIDASWRARFGDVRHVERDYVRATCSISRVSRMVDRTLRFMPPLVHLYRLGHFRVVLAREPRSS